MFELKSAATAEFLSEQKGDWDVETAITGEPGQPEGTFTRTLSSFLRRIRFRGYARVFTAPPCTQRGSFQGTARFIFRGTLCSAGENDGNELWRGAAQFAFQRSGRSFVRRNNSSAPLMPVAKLWIKPRFLQSKPFLCESRTRGAACSKNTICSILMFHSKDGF